jgi:ABC-type transporter Mla subunit MlaD
MSDDGYIQSKLRKTKEEVDQAFDKVEKVQQQLKKSSSQFEEIKQELVELLDNIKKESDFLKKSSNIDKLKKEILEEVNILLAERQKGIVKDFEKEFDTLSIRFNKKFSEASKSQKEELFRESKKIIKDALQRSLNVHISLKDDDKKKKKDYIY